LAAITRVNPAHNGADRLVPPQQHWIIGVPDESAPIKTPGVDAIIEISGMSRLLSFKVPVCHDGFENMLLTPPPLEPHAVSIPPGATPITLMSLPELYCGENCVPPTAVTCGLAAISLGFKVVPVMQPLLTGLYCSPAAPQSPELINTD
jgi:hypothetical protein